MVQLLHVFMITPFIILSSSIIVISTIIAISRTNWLFLWAGLELNLLRFIPIIIYSKSSQETEAAVKYFLIQTVGSRIILIISISLWFFLHGPHQLIEILLLLAILIKIGVAPFHLWYSSVITSLSWTASLILSTWQKLGPLVVVTVIFSNFMPKLLFFIARLNAIVGGLVGINQSHLRTIIAYSSITHIGWIISLIAINKPISTLLYFATYVIIITPLFIIIQIKNLSNRNNLSKLINHSPIYQFIIPSILLSLRGIPPLTGFIPKWITINIVAFSSPPTLIIMIIGAIINTYFYLNIAFNFILRINLNLLSSPSKIQFFPIFLTFLSISCLVSITLLIIL